MVSLQVLIFFFEIFYGFMALLYFCSECFFESIFVFHVGVFLFDLLIGLFKVVDFVLGVFELFFGEVVGEVFDEFVHVDSVV